jgi:hypothetical protein
MMIILETFLNCGKLAENWTSTVANRQISRKNVVKQQKRKYLLDKIEKLAHYLCFFVLFSFFNLELVIHLFIVEVLFVECKKER